MSSPSAELLKAMLTALGAATALTNIVSTRIFAGAAQDAALPYLDIGELEEQDWSSKTFDGGEHFITLHAWSGKTGMKEIQDILQAAKAALHNKVLSVSGSQLVLLRYESSRSFMDRDGITRHGIIQFRALTTEN